MYFLLALPSMNMSLGLFIVNLNLGLFFISIGSWSVVQSNFTLTDKAEVIKCVSDYINDHTIILLTSKSDNFEKELQLKKLINHSLKYYTGIGNFQTITRIFYSDDISSSKMLIVLEYTPSNIQELSLISKKIDMSSFDWLLLSPLPDIDESDFQNISIPINCHLIVSTVKENRLIALEEIYQVSRNSSITKHDFGFWNRERGLHDVKGEIFTKRRNLKGLTFKFAVHNVSGDFDPCSTKTKIDNGRTMIQCTYFKIWQYLGLVLNYTTKYVAIEDCYKNGSKGLSTPMLEMIASGGADSGIDSYVWSSSRLVYNSFLWPMFQSKVILVTKIPSRKFSLSSYVAPFVKSLWFALIGWLILSGTVFNLIKYISQKIIYKESSKEQSDQNERVENFLVPFTAICCQGTILSPRQTAIRIVLLLMYLIPVVFINSYSGSVISSLSVPSENIPFNDLKEFEKDGSYQLTAVNNTFFQLILMTDEKLESLRRKKLISTVMSPSYRQVFLDVCSKKITIMLEKPVLTKNTIQCNVFILDHVARKIFSSMAVRKKFHYSEIFNRQIQKLVITGLNMKILQKYALNIFKHEINPFQEHYFPIKPFGFGDVLPLFAILGGGMLISVLLFVFELKLGCTKRLKEKKLNAHSDKELGTS